MLINSIFAVNEKFVNEEVEEEEGVTQQLDDPLA